MRYGYASILNGDQNLDRQRVALARESRAEVIEQKRSGVTARNRLDALLGRLIADIMAFVRRPRAPPHQATAGAGDRRRRGSEAASRPPPKSNGHQIAEARARLDAGEPAPVVARAHGVTVRTLRATLKR